jgi:adenine specific DNA methylase Mod
MAQLTPAELQEINRFLDAGKPLPDKYRFLLFEDKREVELVWNGKTNEVTNAVLPFQVIEQVDEPRAEVDTKLQMSMFDVDERGRQLRGWQNKLIWGDNKLILSSLKNGPLREEIEKQGGIKLIYIDPPFDVGADFSMDVEIGDDTLTKKANILEEIAYRDTWGKGTDSFISMIYERLILMRDIMSQDGAIYVHCDWRVAGYLRLILDEVFGAKNFLNEIIWSYEGTQSPSPIKLGSKHDTIFRFAKDINAIQPNQLYFEHEIDKTYSTLKQDEKGYFRIQGFGDYSEASIAKFEAEGRVYHTNKGTKYLKHYVEERDGRLFKQKKLPDVWTDVTQLGTAVQTEKIGYPTQKPEKLISRIIEVDTVEGDLVADFFCGSGTTAAVAEKLGRKWIVSDLGKFGVHTTRKRIIGVQRSLKAEGKDFRAFEILNLGKYERQHYVGINENLRLEEQQQQIEARELEFVALILSAYKADKAEGFKTFQGKKSGRLVAVGPVNVPVSRLFVEEVILECRQKHITKVDILGFEFEMGLFPNVLDDARSKGIDISPKHIPAEVFDKRAVDKGQVVFHDVAAIEIKPLVKKNSIAIELTDFSVFYSQDSVLEAEASVKDKGNKIVVEKGQIVKVSKDKDGIVKREQLTKVWTDWIDYWAVDFNFENKREIIRVKNEASGEWEEIWTGDYIFENEWQSFRTKKDRTLELTSVAHECPTGSRKVAVKVVDIFGNDTMTIVEVTIGGKK